MSNASLGTIIRNQIITILKGMTFDTQPGDLPVTIQQNAVIFRKTRAQKSRPGQTSLQNLDLPAIIVSKPGRTHVNPAEWTNEADLWHRSFLVQIVDRDESNNADRQDTWDKWIDQIIAAFQFNEFPNAVYPFTPTWVLATASGEGDIDEGAWILKEGVFISQVMIDVRVGPGAANSRGLIS
jgi:hypothetical protein